MSQPQTFRAVIEDGSGGGAFVTIPFDVEATFGKKRVPVRATIDGAPYQGSLVRMGGSCHLLIIRKDLRAQIGKTIGDEVSVTVEEDTAPRAVVVPADLEEALAGDPSAEAFFRQLAYTHQREYVAWIEEAKRAQTRHERIGRAVAMLREGRKER
jgi:hypothetical protein